MAPKVDGLALATIIVIFVTAIVTAFAYEHGASERTCEQLVRIHDFDDTLLSPADKQRLVDCIAGATQ